jgi:hypothetical protein
MSCEDYFHQISEDIVFNKRKNFSAKMKGCIFEGIAKFIAQNWSTDLDTELLSKMAVENSLIPF